MWYAKYWKNNKGPWSVFTGAKEHHPYPRGYTTQEEAVIAAKEWHKNAKDAYPVGIFAGSAEKPLVIICGDKHGWVEPKVIHYTDAAFERLDLVVV